MLSGEAGGSVTLMLVRLSLVLLGWGQSMEPKSSPWASTRSRRRGCSRRVTVCPLMARPTLRTRFL